MRPSMERRRDDPRFGANPVNDPGATIALSLISHTNAGKTTLARTLLARDVGEVRDAPHVTTEATAYPLIETDRGDALMLWDTPGFGDSARLARRLAQEGNPIGWFLTQVWDRWRDRPFWLTQLAVRNVRDHADVILYLVNAAENPGDAGYLAPELAVLAWMGKPVLVLLNQTGPPRAPEDEAQDVARWRAASPSLRATPIASPRRRSIGAAVSGTRATSALPTGFASAAIAVSNCAQRRSRHASARRANSGRRAAGNPPAIASNSANSCTQQRANASSGITVRTTGYGSNASRQRSISAASSARGRGRPI